MKKLGAICCSLFLVLSAQAEPDAQRFDSMEALLSSQGLVTENESVAMAAPLSADVAPIDTRSSGALLVMNAMAYLGTPYRYGGNNVETGFDCSGFVRAVFDETLGMSLPRRSHLQADEGVAIDQRALEPGDLVFFNTQRRRNSHVGIYIGEGRFIHAPRTGARVRVENMHVSYWRRRFDGARRLTGESAHHSPAPVQTASERYEFGMVPDLAF